MNSRNQTPTNQNKNKNKNTDSGEEEIFKGKGLGQQVCLPTCQTSTRSAGKVTATRSLGRSSRELPYPKPEKPVDVKGPLVRLTTLDVTNDKVEKHGSTFSLMTGKDEGCLGRGAVDSQPGPSGLGNPHTLAEELEARSVGASRDVSSTPTITMTFPGSQEVTTNTEDAPSDSSDGEMDVESVLDAITGEVPREGPGHPPTTGLHVGKREKEVEKARVRRKEEKERRANKALSSTAPTGRKWAWLRGEEEKIEADLANDPTEDIASRLVEQSAIIFKIANCSNNMKGSLVRELHESVALVRAATNLMATRAREARGGGGGNTEGLFKTIEELRAENAWLRGEMELI